MKGLMTQNCSEEPDSNTQNMCERREELRNAKKEFFPNYGSRGEYVTRENEFAESEPQNKILFPEEALCQIDSEIQL